MALKPVENTTRDARGVYYDVAMQRLQGQMERVDALDAKVTNIFTLASGLVVLFGVLASLSGVKNFHAAFLIFMVVSMIAYVVCVTLLWRAYRTRQFDLRPPMKKLQEYAEEHTYSEQSLREWVGDACVESIELNEPLIDEKATMLGWAALPLAVEVFALAAAGLIKVLGNS